MRINNNISAINTHRILNINENNLSKTLERLSSGKSINRASDNAAGLAINEKMTAQIRGLKMASKNSLDGISLVQTAEGALNEMSQIIQRIRELAVQSVNGVYTEEDRNAMQNEVVQLINELDSISNNTEFNGMFLLNGNSNVSGNGNLTNKLSDIVESLTLSGGITDKYNYNGVQYASAIIDFSNLNSNTDIMKLKGQGLHYTCCTCDKKYSIRFVEGDPDTSLLIKDNPIMDVDIRGINNGNQLVKKINETAYGKEYTYIPTESYSGIPSWTEGSPNGIPDTATPFVTHYSQIGIDGSILYIYDHRSNYSNYSWPTSGRGIFEPTVYNPEDDDSYKALLIDIQTGSNKGQTMTIEIPNVTTEYLEIKFQLSVATSEKATLAIVQSDNAMQKILKTRSKLGAYQNRLEHTITNVDNAVENLQSSSSKIADADIALEMSSFVKLKVLNEAGISMLSQANQLPQMMLTLLNK